MGLEFYLSLKTIRKLCLIFYQYKKHALLNAVYSV